MSVRVRFAPSPTGYVHIGGLRTALYNYLFAKKEGGTYLLRVEDTDRTRYVEGAIENLLENMAWAGVMHSEGPLLNDEGEVVQVGDKGPYIQSERTEIYREHVEKLIEDGHAYYCFCSKERLDNLRDAQKAQGKVPRYDGICRGIDPADAKARVEAGESHVVRLKLPANHEVTFEDVVRGRVTVNTDDLDDQVLLKADGYPTYHLAVIVDDHFMEVTHIIRGEEWLPSTPKHVMLYEAFGWEAPKYVHLPNILNSDKKKLSKRHGDVAVEDFRRKGYLPEALINYIALVGWSPEDNRELFTMEELVEAFSLERVSRSSGVFDVNKLNWINGHYIREKDLDELTRLCIPYFVADGYVKEDEVEEKYEWIKKIVGVTRGGIDHLSQITGTVDLFLDDEIRFEDEQAEEMIGLEHVPAMLRVFKEKALALDELVAGEVKGLFKAVQKETGIKGKNLFMPTRVALTGQVHGPEMADIIEILGKEKVARRIDHVLNKIEG
jgi:nondiscriminating glutamyl-tRNA synthetase